MSVSDVSHESTKYLVFVDCACYDVGYFLYDILGLFFYVFFYVESMVRFSLDVDHLLFEEVMELLHLGVDDGDCRKHKCFHLLFDRGQRGDNRFYARFGP
jgi:hypothetical protein